MVTAVLYCFIIIRVRHFTYTGTKGQKSLPWVPFLLKQNGKVWALHHPPEHARKCKLSRAYSLNHHSISYQVLILDSTTAFSVSPDLIPDSNLPVTPCIYFVALMTSYNNHLPHDHLPCQTVYCSRPEAQLHTSSSFQGQRECLAYMTHICRMVMVG